MSAAIAARERWMAKAELVPGGHLIWTGAKNASPRGWFRLSANGRTPPKQADRAGWLLFRGDVPEGHVVRYCKHPGCVNPWHARLQRREDFNAESQARWRRVVTRGSDHPTAKLDEKAARHALRLWNSGWTAKQIRGRVGGAVGVMAIYALASGRTWRHLGQGSTRRRRVGPWRTGRQILTDADVMCARHFRACGYSLRETWRRLGTKASEGAVTSAVLGRSFRHLPMPLQEMSHGR